MLKGETFLYESALKTYDVKIALLVISHCKEYDIEDVFPFLKRLEELGENETRYEVNAALGCNEEALLFLSKCEGRFENCLELVERYSLYASAFKVSSRYNGEFNDSFLSKCYKIDFKCNSHYASTLL